MLKFLFIGIITINGMKNKKIKSENIRKYLSAPKKIPIVNEKSKLNQKKQKQIVNEKSKLNKNKQTDNTQKLLNTIQKLENKNKVLEEEYTKHKKELGNLMEFMRHTLIVSYENGNTRYGWNLEELIKNIGLKQITEAVETAQITLMTPEEKSIYKKAQTSNNCKDWYKKVV